MRARPRRRGHGLRCVGALADRFRVQRTSTAARHAPVRTRHCLGALQRFLPKGTPIITCCTASTTHAGPSQPRRNQWQAEAGFHPTRRPTCSFMGASLGAGAGKSRRERAVTRPLDGHADLNSLRGRSPLGRYSAFR